MTRFLVLTTLCVFGLLPAATVGADKQDFQALLKRPILDANQPLSDVQRFVAARVPPMPEATTVDAWERYAERMRSEILERVVFRGEARHWRDAQASVIWTDTIAGGPGYRIKKLRYEALPGLWIPALLYVPDHVTGRVPAILNVNGHDRPDGKAAKYKQIRCINQAKRGMLALNVEWLGMGQLNTPNFDHYRMNQLDLCGTSGLAPFYLAMSRALDVLLSLEHTDPERVAVAGLSGGGWQTIVISALDTRVKLCNPVAGYSSFRTRAFHFSDLGDSEQTPCDLAAVSDYAQLTAMLAPRPALLTFNAADNCCFAAGHALPPLLESARPVYEMYGKRDSLRAHVNFIPGTHNFEQDNREAFYRSLGDFFFPSDTGFDHKEIPCDEECKTKDELNVPLPEDNLDFHALAQALSRDLPIQADIPTDAAALATWQQEKREVLAEIVQAHSYETAAQTVDQVEADELAVRFWRLRMGGVWTVPVVEFRPREPQATTIVAADGGRIQVATEIQQLVASGRRVLAVDPFYFGESRIAQRDFLFALLVSTVGERPLGIQASQIAATARWARDEFGEASVDVVAYGPRSSLFCLVGAALEENAIAAVELHDSMSSLRDVIEKNRTVRDAPELFCFGLFQRFDIPQLKALVAPRPVK